jgi:uncharacterized membrane protein
MAQEFAQEVVLDPALQSHKNLVWWLYVFHGASFLFSLGMLSFIPLIINYLRRPEAAGTFVYSHHSWQIRSFWWYVLWMCVGGVLFATFVGIPVAMLIWGVAWIWKAYRLIRGFMDLNANKPMPG